MQRPSTKLRLDKESKNLQIFPSKYPQSQVGLGTRAVNPDRHELEPVLRAKRPSDLPSHRRLNSIQASTDGYAPKLRQKKGSVDSGYHHLYRQRGQKTSFGAHSSRGRPIRDPQAINIAHTTWPSSNLEGTHLQTCNPPPTILGTNQPDLAPALSTQSSPNQMQVNGKIRWTPAQ